MVKLDSGYEIALRSYLETKKLDSKSIEKYVFFFHKLINLYPEINQKNIDLFLTHNNNSPCRAMFYNLKSSIIRWDYPDEIKKQIAMIDIPKISGKGEKKIPKFLRQSDIDRLDIGIKTNDEFKDEQIRLMILVQYYGGLRVNELINLRFIDLDFDNRKKNNQFQSIRISSEFAKFGKERVTYIPTFVYKRLINWYKIKLQKGKEYQPLQPIWNIKLSRYKKLFNDWTFKILGESYNTHSLRHGRGFNLTIEQNKSINFVKEYLGHADIKTTQVYTHFTNENIEKELEENINK